MRLLGFTAAAALMFGGIACAQPAPGGGGVRAACAADVQSFCSDVQRGGGRIFACLRDHQDQLSDGCKSALANAHHHWRQDQSGPPAEGPPPEGPPPGGPQG